MRIIDAHIHTHLHSNAEIEVSKNMGIDCSIEGLLSEMKRNDVEKSVCMTLNTSSKTPMDIDIVKQNQRKEIAYVAGINPDKMPRSSLVVLEKALSERLIVGLKIYLGYFPYYPYDRKYSTIFKIAKDNSCPVVFHAGDVFSALVKKPKVRFSHPLNIDEVAVENPDVNFVIAHTGAPWVVDAAEVIYKNPNVYADVSAFLIGKNIRGIMHYENAVKMLQYAFGYVDNPEKFMYGSDWPLVKMDEYISFVKEAAPRSWHDKIFYGNAKKIFGI